MMVERISVLFCVAPCRPSTTGDFFFTGGAGIGPFARVPYMAGVVHPHSKMAEHGAGD